MTRSSERPTVIDKNAIVVATLRIIDTDGIDAVTMRRLGTELGVSAMAAYRHVGNKNELLQAAAASIVADMQAPTAQHWQDVVQLFFEEFHDRLLRHPGVARLFGGQTFLSEPVYAVSDPVFAALLDAGFDAETAVSLFMACATCSIGGALLEAEEAQQRCSGHGEKGIVLRVGQYPAITAVSAHLPSRQTPKAHSTALRNLIAGYAATLDADR